MRLWALTWIGLFCSLISFKYFIGCTRNLFSLLPHSNYLFIDIAVQNIKKLYSLWMRLMACLLEIEVELLILLLALRSPKFLLSASVMTAIVRNWSLLWTTAYFSVFGNQQNSRFSFLILFSFILWMYFYFLFSSSLNDQICCICSILLIWCICYLLATSHAIIVIGIIRLGRFLPPRFQSPLLLYFINLIPYLLENIKGKKKRKSLNWFSLLCLLCPCIYLWKKISYITFLLSETIMGLM